MSGLFLVISMLVGIVFLLISIISHDYDIEEGFGIVGVVCLVIALFFIIGLPVSRIDSKTNVEYFEVFQKTLDSNRENGEVLNVFERTAIIDEINSKNKTITIWKVKGNKWYNNKWYYHPSTRNVEYIK